MQKINKLFRRPLVLTALSVIYLFSFIGYTFQLVQILLSYLSFDNTIAEFFNFMNSVSPGFTLAFIFLLIDIGFFGFLSFLCLKRKKAALEFVPLIGILSWLMYPLYFIFVTNQQENIMFTTQTELLFGILGFVSAMVMKLVPAIISTLIVYRNREKFVN